MIEILKFIFSSFWVWAGTAFLIGTLGNALAAVISALRGKE